jgi:hypothetical protein
MIDQRGFTGSKRLHRIKEASPDQRGFTGLKKLHLI